MRQPLVPAWRDRVIGSSDRTRALPDWLQDSYDTFRHQLLDPAYPCFFGTQAERRGEMFYAALDHLDMSPFPDILTEFVRRGGEDIYRRHNLAVFLSPEPDLVSHAVFERRFWDILQYLHERDPCPDSARHCDPSDPEWEFCFADCQMFVVGASPSYRRRRSRNLGPGIVLLFQPRAVFIDLATEQPISAAVRNNIRARMERWDGMVAHPDMGTFGDPMNHEWKQYCLPDDNAALTGACPFINLYRAGAKT